MIEGTLKANGLAISHIECDHIAGGWVSTSRVHFIGIESGQTQFSTEYRHGLLSKETREAFERFLGLLEQEAAEQFFGTESQKKGLDMADPPPDQPPSGIGEHVGEEQV